MRDFNEGIDVLLNVGLDGMPVANKLWAWLATNTEASVSPTTVRSGLTKVGTALSVTGRSSVSRIIDLGLLDFSASNSGTIASVVVSTDDPAVGTAKVIVIQDVNGGATLDLAVTNGLIVDDLSFAVDYLVSGSVA
jgi:hypothetical protein